jgi:GAF domain-containing protein
MKAALPENEAERLNALHQFEILDTKEEKVFDDLTRLAIYICKTPIALITLIDSDRQWFKSRVGVSQFETARDVSFCSHAILQTDSLVVPDTLQDERFKNNPLVVSEPHLRFYAGSPLTTAEGYKLGTLCVIDNVPRELSDGQIAALKTLSYQAMMQLELRREIILLQRLLNEEKRKIQALENCVG